jgi:hypothetical protein
MKISLGAIVVAVSGKLGGHVGSRNRGGAYLRTRVKPVNPQSAAQMAVRASFALNTKAWSSLTEVQRSAWNGATSLMQRVNSLGNSFLLSGKALYQSLNNNLAAIGVAAISSPPVPGAGFSFTTMAIVADVSLATIIATFTAAIPATHKVIVQATPPVAAGVTYVKNLYRQISALSNANNSPQDLTAVYEAVHGDWLTAGQVIYFRFYAVDVATGIKNLAGETKVTVVA